MNKKRKIPALIFAFITLFACAFAFSRPVYAAAFYTDIRVLLSIGSVRSLDLTLIGDYYLKEDVSFEFTSDKLTVSAMGGRPVLTSGDKTFTASTITLASRDYDGTSAYIRLKNSRYGTCTYLGDITLDVSGGYIRAINALPIEHYLYGVVPYEMSNTFPMEALKAQAVCARGYAVANCSKYRLRAYDILDTSADQVYHGYFSRYTRAIAAVNETAGQVLTYKGEIIQAYYSASNGGQTELTGNVWANDLPYYIPLDDEYDLANPSSLEEKSFIPAEFSAETIALMDELVFNMLQTGANKAAGEEVTLLGTIRVKARDAKYAPPSRSYTKADVTLMVALPDGSTGQLTVTLSLDNLVYSEDNPDGIFNISRTLRMRGAEPGIFEQNGREYEGFFITNRRWGHGVGLSQRGAQQRATEGINSADILAFYYSGTKLNTIGTFASAPALTSKKYIVAESFLSGIQPDTSPAKLLSGLASDGGELSVISSSGADKPEGRMETGDFVRTAYDGGSSYFDLPVVIYGDVDGNGRIGQSDLDALQLHLLNSSRLGGPYLEAADANHDGAVDNLDLLQLIKYIHGALSIDQKEGDSD